MFVLTLLRTVYVARIASSFRPNTIVIDIPYHTEDPGHGVTPRGPEDPSQ